MLDSSSFNINAATSLSGKTIGKYQLHESLGSGGMATVYRASQLPLGRTVAVKVLHPHLTQQESFRSRFLREAKAVASLRHPHIVQMYDYDFQDGVCYMALEFLDGHSLEDQLTATAAQGGQPLAEALAIATQVAEALQFAHKQHIIHRDIKPANMMRTADGRVVLTDFGIATVLHETRFTVDGGTSGTPSYMSPEQALGERGDERSDIYSLGAVLYELVTGRLPFEADTLYGLIMMHVNEPPPPASQVNPNVPLAVERIICKAMAKSPADRYQTAAEFAADLEAVAAGRAVEITLPLPEPATLPQPARAQKPVWLWGGVAAALVLVLGAATILLGNPAQPDPALELTAMAQAATIAEAQAEMSVTAEAVEAAMLVAAATATAQAVAVFEEEPDFTSSMAAQAQVDEPFVDAFDGNVAGWPITQNSVARQLVEGAYQIRVDAPDRAVSTVPEKLKTYDQFRYTLDAVLVEGQPESGYGLVFHRRNAENYYVFAVNGLRQWSVWRLVDGTWQELRQLPNGEEWTPAEAILPFGETNRLQIEVAHDTFTLFVNDHMLHQLSDPAAPVGGGLVGMYVASSRTAEGALAQVRFDNLALEPLSESETPSMTATSK